MDRFDKTLVGLFVLLILGSVFWFNSFIVPFSSAEFALDTTVATVGTKVDLAKEANTLSIEDMEGSVNKTIEQAEEAGDFNRDENQNKDDETEKKEKEDTEGKQNIYAGAFKAGMSLFSKKLAEDTAIWVASGGKGQQPLFVTEGWDAYLKDIGDAALGEAIDEFMTGKWGEGAFMDLCEPNFNIKLGIILGINQEKIKEPRCKFSDIVNNWESAIDNADFSLEYRVAIQRENDINLYLRTQGRQFEVVDRAVGIANDKLNATEGWLDKEGYTGLILTPGSVVRAKYEDSVSAKVAQWTDVNPTETVFDFIQTFLNTLASQLLKNLQNGGLFSGGSGGSRSGYDYLSSLYGYSSSPNRSDASAASERFNNSVELNYQGGSQYDILSKLMLCTDKKKTNPGPTDCVIDAVLSSAISNKTLVRNLAPSVLNRPFAPKVDQVVNPQTAFTLRNVTILRKYRIVPVGWEIAARYISEQSDRGYTLGELVDLYYADDADCAAFADDDHFLCGLIDPFWVLKAPELFCRREGYGPNLSLSGDDRISRIDYCADEQQCLKEDDNGSCLNFGYCTEEKRVWDLGADSCEPINNTCQAVMTSDGEQEAYLTNTLDYANCDRDNAGCKWYSQDKRYNVDLELWKWTTSTPMMFFDRDVEACNSRDEGCSQFIRTGADLGSNLLINGSFEDSTMWPNGDIVDNDDVVVDPDINMEDYLLHRGNKAYLLTDDRTGSQIINLRAGDKYALSALVFTKEIPDTGNLTDYSYPDLVGVGVDLDLSDVDNSNLTPVIDGVWQQVYKIFTSDNDQAVKVSFNYSDVGIYYFDDIQLEKLNRGTNGISDYTDYDPSKRPPSQLAYLKKAPDYYGCYDTNTASDGIQWPQTLSQLNALLNNDSDDGPVMNAECNNYAGVCIASEVGCQLYTPINGDPAVPATITSNDLCPSECVGYQSYRQEKTNFINSRYTQFIADDTPQYCSASYAGCDEFTNIDTVGGGGEGLEYYVNLRECQKPGEGSEGTFVTWRGDDTRGYALKDYKLRRSSGINLGAPSTNIRYNDDGNPFSVDHQISVTDIELSYLETLDESVENAIDFVAAIDPRVVSGDVGAYLEYLNRNNNITDSEILNPAVLESLHDVGICIPQEIRGYSYYDNDGTTEVSVYVPINPDCTEFYSSDGIISYRLLSRVIYVDESCKPYRRTQTQSSNLAASDDCINSSGHWNANEECIYRAIPNQGVTCPASSKGCREYVGNQGGNVRNISYDTFEGEIGGWSGSGAVLTQEAASAGGMSVRATNLKKNILLNGNKAYILSFWAKGVDNGETNFSHITFFNGDTGVAGELKYFADANNTDGAPNIKVGDLWQRYELGPVFIDWNPGVVELDFLAGGNGVYLDNILLKAVKDSVYLTENSWWTPFSCDNKLDDPDGSLAVGELSCEATGARTRCSVGEMLGCNSYKDLNKDTFNLRSFESLCRRDAVGCEELIDTHNSNSHLSENYNTENDAGDVNGGSLLEGMLAWVTSMDNVIIPTDQTVYLVNDPDYSCDANNKGCTAYGLPTIVTTPTGLNAEEEEITGWRDVYYNNNPDRYTVEPDATLCEIENLWCEEYAVDDSYIYFKDPRDKRCEYQIGSDGEYGWYKGADGSKVLCATTDMMTIGLGTKENKEQPVGQKNFMIGTDGAYSGWVGVCPADQSGCSEYIDPSTNIYTNLILRENGSTSQDVYIESDTLYSVSATLGVGPSVYITCDLEPNSKIISPDYSMDITNPLPINAAGDGVAAMWGQSGRFYISGSISGESCSLHASGVSDLALVKSGVYYVKDDLNKQACGGIVDADNGCVLFNSRKNMNIRGGNFAAMNNYLTYDSMATGKGPLNPVLAGPGAADADIIAKVIPNRECYSWLHCTTYEKDDPDSFNQTSFGDKDRCLDIGLCTSLNSNGQCNNLVVSSSNGLAPMDYDSSKDVNKTGYAYYGKDSIIGYAPYHLMQQIGEVANVTNGNFESTFDDTDEPLGWVAYNTIAALRLPVPEGLDIIEDMSESREGASYLRLNTSYEAESEVIDAFSGTSYMFSGWINTLDLYPYHEGIKAGLLIKELKHDGTTLDTSKTSCSSSSDCSFWIYDSDWQVWDDLIARPGLPWRKYYKSVITGLGVGRIKIKLANWSEVPVGTANISCDSSVGIRHPGNGIPITEPGAHSDTGKTVCDVGGMSYFDNINVKPFLQVAQDGGPVFAERLCRLYPKYNSPSCDYMQRNKTYHGWSGYCLTKDPENPKICLQWWPIDRIKGDTIDDSGGYEGKIPVYYTLDGESETIYEYRHAFLLGNGRDGCGTYVDSCGDGYKLVTTYYRHRRGKDKAECGCIPEDPGNIVQLDGNTDNFIDTPGETNGRGRYHPSGYLRSANDGWYKHTDNSLKITSGRSYQIRQFNQSEPDNSDAKGDKHYQDLCPLSARQAGTGYCYYSKELSRNRFFATKLVRTVTPAGNNKSWFSRVFDGSSFRIDLGSQSVAYGSTNPFIEPPFGSATPPAPINTPALWDGDDDISNGRQPLLYNPVEGATALGVLYSCQGCPLEQLRTVLDYSIPESDSRFPYQYFNFEDLAGTSMKGRDLIKKIFAQSYNIYNWMDLNGNYCSFATGKCTEDSNVDCTSHEVCSQNIEVTTKACNFGVEAGKYCTENPNCAFDISGSCLNWTADPDGEAPYVNTGLCSLVSDGGGGEEWVWNGTDYSTVVVPQRGCGGASQADADLTCWTETTSSTCSGVCSGTGLNAGLSCDNDPECQKIGGSCVDVIDKTNYNNLGVCQGECFDKNNNALGSSCVSNSDCFANPAYVEVEEPGWSVPNIMCCYDTAYDTLGAINQRRPGDEKNGFDFCGVAPVVKNIKVDDKSGDINISGGSKVVRLDFNVSVNSNQLPLASYRIDWGDGTAISVSGVNLKDRPNDLNKFALYHYYDFWQLKAASLRPASGVKCTDSDCTVNPKVHVRDSWGWCNASGTKSSAVNPFVASLTRKGYYSGNNSYKTISTYYDLEQWAIDASASYLYEGWVENDDDSDDNTVPDNEVWADYWATGVFNQYNAGWWNLADRNYAWCKPKRNESKKIHFTFDHLVNPDKLEVYFAGPNSGWNYPSSGNGENYGLSLVEVKNGGNWETIFDSSNVADLHKVQKNSFIYAVDLSGIGFEIKEVRIEIPGADPVGAENGVWGCVDAVKLIERGGVGDSFDCDVGAGINSDAWTSYSGIIKILKD